MSELLGAIFESRTREQLLRLLISEGISASESELARRCGVSPKAVANEVRKLSRVGLVDFEVLGASKVVHLNREHPAVRPLRDLLRLDELPDAGGRDQAYLQALAYWGAPFALVEGKPAMPLEAAFLEGVKAAKTNGAVLRVLPLVLAKQLARIDWVSLIESAKRQGLKAELGAIVALTADILGRKDLADRVALLHDRRCSSIRYLPEPRSSYERQLAEERTPDVVRPWRVRMNMSRDSFASLFEKHLA
jgi:DNA-binding MarR family transcriptional regulator